MPKLTIIDIANIAGVSPSTVSLVMNNRPGVSAATREQVLEIVRQTNFVPSQSARSQIMKITQNVAVLYNAKRHPLDHLFHEGLNRRILEYCTHKYYNLIFVACEFKDNMTPDAFPPILRSRGVDGVISYGYVPHTVITGLRQLEMPYLILDNHQPNVQAMSVSVDYYSAAKMGMHYLVEKGHSRIAYIGSAFPPSYSTQTFAAYQNIMGDQRVMVPLQWIQMKLQDIESDEGAYMQMQSILDSGDLPTAVFCSADIYAVGAMRAIKERGLHVPQDISLMSIDDILISSYVDPPLTTVKVDSDILVQIGCKMLFDSIEEKELVELQKVYDDFTIIERQSVCEIKKG